MAFTMPTWTTVALAHLCGLFLLTAAQVDICPYAETTMLEVSDGEYAVVQNQMPAYSDLYDQCACTVTTTDSQRIYLHLNITLTRETSNEIDMKKETNDSCSALLTLQSSNHTKYACSGKDNSRSHTPWEKLTNDNPFTFGIYNPGHQNIDLHVGFKVYGGDVRIECDTQLVTIDTSSCPCGGHMPIPVGGIPMHRRDPSYKKNLTAALVSTFLFLAIIAVIVAIYWFLKKRQDIPDTEKGDPANVGGKENKAFQTSKASLHDKGKVNTDPDPTLKLKLQTPTGSINDNSTDIHPYRGGSTDSGLYSMPGEKNHPYNGELPYARANSMDEMNRSQPNIAGRPDLLGPGRDEVKLSPAELDALYAKPHKVRNQHQPNGPPQSYGPQIVHPQQQAPTMAQPPYHGSPAGRQPPGPMPMGNPQHTSSMDNLNMPHNVSFGGSKDSLNTTSQSVETDV